MRICAATSVVEVSSFSVVVVKALGLEADDDRDGCCCSVCICCLRLYCQHALLVGLTPWDMTAPATSKPSWARRLALAGTQVLPLQRDKTGLALDSHVSKHVRGCGVGMVVSASVCVNRRCWWTRPRSCPSARSGRLTNLTTNLCPHVLLLRPVTRRLNTRASGRWARNCNGKDRRGDAARVVDARPFRTRLVVRRCAETTWVSMRRT